MYCPKCGCSFPDGVETCTYCGGKLIELETEETAVAATGPETETGESTTVLQGVIQTGKSKIRSSWDLMTNFNRVMTVSTLTALLLCLFAFCFGKILGGLLGIAMVCLLLAAWMLHHGVLKSPNRHLYQILMAVALVLLIPYFFSWKIGAEPAEEPEPVEVQEAAPQLSWPAHPLARLLPQPDTGCSDVLLDTDRCFSAAVEELSREQFEAYAEACKGAGFTEEAVVHPDFRDLRNREDYALSLFYSEDGRMVVTLRAPMRTVELTVVCEENRLFNRYAVEVFVDGEKLTKLLHGTDHTQVMELQQGSHELTLVNPSNTGVTGSHSFTVTEDGSLKFSLRCVYSEIQVTES